MLQLRIAGLFVDYLRGWAAYFGISQYYRPVPELDDWVRRRVRMCYWKQWRWVRTKIRHLLALGVSLKTAIQHGVSSKSYWHMARTPAVQQGLNNAWLQEQGLLSVKDLWCKVQGYTAKGKRKASSSEPTWLFRPLRTRMVWGLGARNPRLPD
jgi:Group II intron, maturase-specific domain